MAKRAPRRRLRRLFSGADCSSPQQVTDEVVQDHDCWSEHSHRVPLLRDLDRITLVEQFTTTCDSVSIVIAD